MVDAPCGDFFWMQYMDLPIEQYIGVDIVKKLIGINQAKYANEKISFQHIDITSQVLPKVDIVLCRDCLGHLSNAEVMKVIRLLKKSGCKYFLTTSFLIPRKQRDIYTGGWRAINLLVEPFCFPPPLEIINERCLEKNGTLEDKSPILWEIDALPNI